MPTDQDYLNQALHLAISNKGQCAPNPSVGAVLVQDDKIIGQGCHHGPGTDHAEVAAIKACAAEITDATLYVTLEPCSHHGRTPPCTDAIITNKIKKVVYGFADPNPQVNGLSALEAASIETQHLSTNKINLFYQSYAHWQTTKLPTITAKMALSLDGKIAGPNQEPMQISGEHMHQFTHFRRAKSDAILTTVNTIYYDNPQFNARLPDTTLNKPVYVVDPSLNIPKQAQIFNTSKRLVLFYNATQATPSKWLQASGASSIPMPYTEDMIDLLALQTQLGEQGHHDIWLESGGTFLSACLEAGIIGTFHVALCNKVYSPQHHAAFIGQPLNTAKTRTWRQLAIRNGYLATFTW